MKIIHLIITIIILKPYLLLLTLFQIVYKKFELEL